MMTKLLSSIRYHSYQAVVIARQSPQFLRRKLTESRRAVEGNNQHYSITV